RGRATRTRPPGPRSADPGRSCAHPAAVARRRLDVLARHGREVVRRHAGLDHHERPATAGLGEGTAQRTGRLDAEPPPSPGAPEARASWAYGHGGRSSRSVRRTTGRKICQPPLFTTTTMGESPWRGACAISGPVIWKAPSPHRTSGRTPEPICAPSAPGTP